ADAIEWCARNLRNGVFVNSTPEPPLPFQSGYFDVVYCFSLFTHLDERRNHKTLVSRHFLLRSAYGRQFRPTPHGRSQPPARSCGTNEGIVPQNGGKDETIDSVLEAMRETWDDRARHNARHYVSNSKDNWEDDDFFQSGEATVNRFILTDMANICQGKKPESM